MHRLALVVLLLALTACSRDTAPSAAPAAEPPRATATEQTHAEHADPITEAPTTAHAGHAGQATTEARQQGPRRSRAARLVAATRRSLRRWTDVAAAEAAGFRSLEDDEDRYVHYMNVDWMLDGKVLDARRPESLVYEKTAEGTRLVSAMYVLSMGTQMEDVPSLGDRRVRWHTHGNLCFSPDGTLAGHLVDGECTPGGINIKTPPMLHVWLIEHPCGPFADLGNGGCKHDH